MMDYKALQDIYELDVYPKRDVVLIKGKNAHVWDSQGRVYIDCTAGHGVASIGHCNEQVTQAIAAQARMLITCSGIFYNDKRALLMKKLVEIAPGNLKKVFLCNSGTEAIEAAIKFARYATKKEKFVCATRGFHGRTMGALSATHQPEYRKDFEPLVPGFSFVPFNNFDKLEQAVDDKTAGILLEVVQGEGGVHIGKPDYFEKVRRLCDERNILLIVDEVQTGFCRTGRMFACQHFHVQPDILCLAKAIAGGVPMGAVLCTEKIHILSGKHGSTFGGNPLSCAAAIAAIDFMIENRLDHEAEAKGKYLVERLDPKASVIREIRHFGLMVGIELKAKVKPYILKLLEKGVLVLPAGSTVLRLLPPLTITYEDLDTVAEKINDVLRSQSIETHA